MVLSTVQKRTFLATGLVLIFLFLTRRDLPHVPERLSTQLTLGQGIQSHHGMLKEVRQWQRKEQIRKIVGLVFYGRRDQASILDCYLKRNLAKNGGVLDEVVWLQRTENKDDLAFLEKLVSSDSHYMRVDVDRTEGGYASAYDGIEDDVLYVKIDTDIVYIEDTTILSMVHTRATRPDYYLIGANVINQPLSSWLHWSLGAVRPYLPENTTSHAGHGERQKLTPVDWRASSLPEWSAAQDFDIGQWSPPEDRKHRWLPVRKRTPGHTLDGTPILSTTYNAYESPGWWNWVVGAQQHYSFFENLETDQLRRYRFDLWDYRDYRMGLQLVTMTGRDINSAKPIAEDDEGYFCVEVPKRTGRYAAAAGGGVASHYSFGAQKGGMDKTDILDRYRSYAQDNICREKMLWTSEEDDAAA
ncbi:hypothetical protein ED733_000038 [Metarhizium rileyi]|uniref:Uncharacterized protein n=1 Tax=Metarhizium rileyi (strain RCEF 4871) TaxID=1649241 RepID=A0A5C6G3I9_METRR|nr:hypothetical protein ED733_000038 [Metarhizium rileyi]